MRRPQLDRWRRWDLAAGLALIATSQVEVWATDQISAPSTARHAMFALATAVAAASVLGRDRAPLAMALLASAATALAGRAVPHGDSITGLLAVLLTVYAAGSRLSSRSAVVALVVSVGLGASVGQDAADWWFVTVLFTAAWLAGRAARRYRLVVDDLSAANEQIERQAGSREKFAAAEERARIAREVHDVLAHTVSVMVVQAEAAEELLERDAAKARTAIVAVQETGREALGEMRQLLSVLRTEASEDSRDPQPGLDRLPHLVSELRAAGLDIDLTINGDRRHLSPGIELCAYRVVQEALTNILKHSTADRAEVAVTFAPHDLRVTITDDGAPAEPVEDGGAGGHGLIGIRERVAMYDGTVRVGALATGGFEVTCTIPYQVTSR